MPELPYLEIYLERLRALAVGSRLESLRVQGPMVLQTVSPRPSDLAGSVLVQVERLGKRLVFEWRNDVWDGPRYAVVHLMIAGRFLWSERLAEPPNKKFGLASFAFERGTLHLNEYGTKRRATLHLLADPAGLAAHDRGGLEPLTAGLDAFAAALTRERRTLKRALADPRLFAGIGNAFSDELLHEAQLSPMAITTSLAADDLARLHAVVQSSLRGWVERLRLEVGDGFPGVGKGAGAVTAFHPAMRVHGRFREPCGVCGTAIQRIVFADNESNYCPRCQTGGRLLSDRAFARLLKDDWPKRIEELEAAGLAVVTSAPRAPVGPPRSTG
ncbi:MAG: formamidopyrimidine-DNA glycosylase [Myxococcales bacterium]|nr:formamidopyrimidine-DNA glycosylase [Myxococcales bacterium]